MTDSEGVAGTFLCVVARVGPDSGRDGGDIFLSVSDDKRSVHRISIYAVDISQQVMVKETGSRARIRTCSPSAERIILPPKGLICRRATILD